MEVALYVADAVVIEGRRLRAFAREHGVSKSWVQELVARFKAGGYEAVHPRSKAPRCVANRISGELEDRVVRLRKELLDQGFDAGAHTIHYHLSLTDPAPPSISTIWRVLKRRGFVTPEPHKRPKSSYIRFEASLPNECRQSDITFYELKDGSKVEILNFLDDFSRVCVASKVFATTCSPDVVATLYGAGGAWGLPASLLTDIQTRWRRLHRRLPRRLLRDGVRAVPSRHHLQALPPLSPTDLRQGRALPPDPKEVPQQAEEGSFGGRAPSPGRSLRRLLQRGPTPSRQGRMTPSAAFDSRAKAMPRTPEHSYTRELRVRHDKVDQHGTVTIRYMSKLHTSGWAEPSTGHG